MFAWTCIDTSELPRARDLLHESAVLNAPDVSPGRCYYLIALGYLGLQEGRFADAAAHLEEALDLAQRLGDHYAEICARLFVTYVDVYRGRNQEARACCERGLDTALAHRSPNGEAFMRLSLGYVELAERQLSAAAVELQASFEILGVAMPLLGAHCRFLQAAVALAQGSPLEARERAAEAVRLGRQLDVWVAIEFGLIVQASLARGEGDPHHAEDLLHDALDTAYRLGARPVMSDVLEALGGALADQDRHEEAARLLGAAQALRDSIGSVRFLFPVGNYEADVAAVRDAIGPGTFDRAWADGSGLSLDEAVAYARRGRGARKRPSHGWPSLTPTEAQVVELVAQGLTNPQIGERLFISKRTVQTHLAHVFTKLGVSSRAELAAATAQQQAAPPA
jgi:DNA-binding CsgD family transcriptional regulator